MATLLEKPPVGEFVIEADWALTCESDKPRLLPKAEVHVVKDRIERVSDSPIRADCPRIVARGQLLLPGFISGHTHACSATPTRGIIETGRSFARPYELVEEFSDEQLDALTAFNVAELLRSGCTTHVEMSLSPKQCESYVRIARQWALRAYPGGMIPGPDRWESVWFSASDQPLLDSVSGTLAEIEQYRKFALGINGTEDDRIRPMMMPHATDTHTPETLRASIEVAKELGNGIHIHLAQSPDEVARVERLWGKRPVEWLDELGLFSERVFGAHLWHVDLVQDPPILTRTGKFTYAHCPSSLGAGGSNGTQPWPELLAAGVNTSIGVDTHSNDYVENIKLAVLNGRARYFLLREHSQVPMVLPSPWDAVNAATIDAARGLGRDDLGRIQPGAKADFCTVDVTGLLVGVGASPPEPLNNLLYAHGLSVRHVATDGVFQVWDGHLIIDDEERVIQQGGDVVAALWAQLDAEEWFTPTPSHPAGWPYTWKAANVPAETTA
jgi:5-methylthioadenosine/S-adenosylhomocysteine deaminase